MKNFIISLFVASILCSCTSVKNVTYFQDINEDNKFSSTLSETKIKVQPNDKLTIIVSGKVPELANVFNVPLYTTRIGNQNNSYTGSQQITKYTVNENGEIDFPSIGKINVNGMTRLQIADKIKSMLIEHDFMDNPIVSVEFENLTFSILGEVDKPGLYHITKDQLTLLDAISMAGDLKITGKRTDIVVLRKEGDKQLSYKVNLCSAKELYSSPAFYLKQNDVIYINPNDMRVRQSTINGNNVRSSSFWISLTSLLTAVTTLFIK